MLIVAARQHCQGTLHMNRIEIYIPAPKSLFLAANAKDWVDLWRASPPRHHSLSSVIFPLFRNPEDTTPLAFDSFGLDVQIDAIFCHMVQRQNTRIPEQHHDGTFHVDVIASTALQRWYSTRLLPSLAMNLDPCIGLRVLM